jgi:hypothetical protein
MTSGSYTMKQSNISICYFNTTLALRRAILFAGTGFYYPLRNDLKALLESVREIMAPVIDPSAMQS